MSKVKFVEVRWIDAVFSSEWEDMDNLVTTEECISRGWLVADEEDHIVLALTIAADDVDVVGGTCAIPKGMIVKKRELKVTYGKSSK